MRKFLFTTLALGGAWSGFGYYFSERVIHIKKKDEQEIINREMALNHLIPEEYNKIPKEEIWISSPHGYKISCVLLKPHAEKKYVIFSHGVTESKMSSIKYANLFLKRGFNAIIYDQRRHGKTGGTTTSYGYFEKDDLKAIVDWLKDREDDILLGIHGESMGAATTLLYAGELGGEADFYVVDCPFSDLEELLAFRMKCELKYMPPSILLPLGDPFLKLRAGFSMKNVSPISAVQNIHKPVLFIHSAKDDYILPYMTRDLYEQKTGEKMLFIAKNGAHAQSLNENRLEYEEILDQFLKKYQFL